MSNEERIFHTDNPKIKPLSNKNFKRITNPYQPYDIESGHWFYHEDLVKKIKMLFESVAPKKIIVIQGSMGTGKTSTLKRMTIEPEILGEGYLPIYLDVSHL